MCAAGLHVRRFGLLAVAASAAAPGGAAAAPARPIRILHVMSYHSPWRWTDGQLEGRFESEPGRGSTFIVTLPLASAVPAVLAEGDEGAR